MSANKLDNPNLKASTSELFEAFYTLILDEYRAIEAEVTEAEARRKAQELTYNLELQDVLLTEVAKSVRVAG